jgi:hypothetical protein
VRGWWVPAVAVVLATVMVLVRHPWEGPVLLTVSHYHGVHVSDVIVLAGLAVVLLLWYRRVND